MIVFGLWVLWRKITVLIPSCQGHILATSLVTVTSVDYPDVRVRFVLCEVPLHLPFLTVPLKGSGREKNYAVSLRFEYLFELFGCLFTHLFTQPFIGIALVTHEYLVSTLNIVQYRLICFFSWPMRAF